MLPPAGTGAIGANFQLYIAKKKLVKYTTDTKKNLVPALAFSICAGSTAVAEVSFPGKEPGKAKVECSESSASLSNKMFTASFRKAGSGVVFDGMKTAEASEEEADDAEDDDDEPRKKKKSKKKSRKKKKAK